MKIQKPDVRFVPSVCNGVVTVFAVPKSRMTPHLLSDTLVCIDADSGAVEGHVDRLLARREGRAGFAEMLSDLDRPLEVGFNYAHLRDALKYPIYSSQLPDGSSFAWTLDIFNPGNEDWRYPGYDGNHELVALVIDASSFKPYCRLGEDRTLAEIAAVYRVLFDMVVKMYRTTKAAFVFGTAGNHLHAFCNAHHWAVRKLKAPLDVTELVWEWAIYPPDLRERIVLDPVQLESTRCPTRDFPCMGLWTRELEGGSVLVYAYENFVGEVGAYAEVLGLKSVFDVALRPVRSPRK